MRKWLVPLTIVAAVGYGGWAFWSLGSVEPASPGRILLVPEQGFVEVAPAGTDQWARREGESEVRPGDRVRTTADGAVLKFFGQGETRLDARSEIVVRDARRDGSMEVRLELLAGRIWSRVVRLTRVDDVFSAQAGSVISTVRGTAFDLQTAATGTTVWVSDSAVQLRHGSSAPVVLTEGYMASFSTTGALERSQPFSDAARQSSWFQKNSGRDAAFAEEFDRDLDSRLRGLNGARPHSFRESLSKISQSLHLAVERSRRAELYSAYVLRRLYALTEAAEEGNQGLALQEYAAVEEEVNTKLSSSDGAMYRPGIQQAVREMGYHLANVGPASPLYRFKQRLEDLAVKLAESEPSEAVYVRLLALDARLDEASMLIAQSSLDEARTALDAARDGLANVSRQVEAVPPSKDPARLSILKDKMDVLRLREAGLRVRLATALVPPLASGQTGSIATFTVPSSSPSSTASEPAPTEATSTQEFVQLRLTASPSPAMLGDDVRLTVKATDETGKSVDVTAKARFVLVGSTGILNGPTYQATAVGTVTLRAELDRTEGEPLVSELRLTVREKPAPAVKPVSLEISPVSGRLSSGQSATFAVLARYSDGSSKDVTNTASFSASNGRIGYFVRNVFSTNDGMQGSVRIVATWIENGITLTASSDLEIL